jgi:integrase
MGYTKDLWTRPEKGPDDKVKRVPNARWGKGKRWLACWLDPNGEERTKAFTTKTPATKYWRDMEADRDRGEYYDAKAGKEKFGTLGKRWLSSRVVDPSTKQRYEEIYRLHIEPTLGNRAVKSIKPSELQSLLAALREKRAGSTVKTARNIMLGVFELAVDDELIRKNPARSKTTRRSSSGDGIEHVQAWSDEQVFALTDAHPESLRLMPTIAATCGHREGEVFAIAVEDIDYDEGIIHIRRQLKKIGRDHVFALPKNDRERIVPMSAWTAESIRTHVRKFQPQPLTLPWEKPTGELRTHNVLFRWIDGGHMKPRAYSETVWKPAIAAAGIIPEPVKDARGRRRYTTTRKEGIHQLRHYYASVMLADGVNIKELAEYLGHADPGFTLRIYSHMLPDSHERARKAIDARMFRPRVVSANS